MVDVLLLNPRTELEKKEISDDSLKNKKNKISNKYLREPPNGILLLASYLEEEGYSVEILDCSIVENPFEYLRKNAKKYRLLGFTALTNTINKALELSKCAKRYNPHLFIIGGGPHVTFEYETILKNYPFVDAICVGESENSFPWLVKKLLFISSEEALDKNDSELLNKYKNHPGTLQKILSNEKDIPKGIVFLEKSLIDPFTQALRDLKPIKDYSIASNRLPLEDRIQLIFTGFPSATSLDFIPLPARHLIDMKYDVADVLINRGCPNKCSFCARTQLFPKFRVRPLENVFQELDQIKSYTNYKFVNFYDNINVNHQYFEDFLNKLIETKFPLPWGAELRVDLITEKEANLMKESNCKVVATGIESADPNILSQNFKNQNPNKVKQGISILKKNGIALQAYFMIGLPGETKEAFKNTIEYLKTLPLERDIDQVNFFVTTLYPGSELWNNRDKYGLKLVNFNYNLYNCKEIVFETPTLSYSDLRQMIAKSRDLKIALGL